MRAMAIPIYCPRTGVSGQIGCSAEVTENIHGIESRRNRGEHRLKGQGSQSSSPETELWAICQNRRNKRPVGTGLGSHNVHNTVVDPELVAAELQCDWIAAISLYSTRKRSR